MRLCRVAIILSLFIALSSISIRAQSVHVLTWQECIELLSKNNADLLSGMHNLKSTEAQVGIAHSGFFPQLSADLNYLQQGSNSIGTGVIDPITGTTSAAYSRSGTNYVGSLNISQNLFSGLQTMSLSHQSEALVRSSVAALAITKANISYEFRSAFEAIVFAKNSIVLTHQIRERRAANLKLVELRFQSGRENRGSVLLSKAYLADANFGDLQARDTLRVATRQLAKVLGLDEAVNADSTLDVSGEVPVSAPAQTEPDLHTIVLLTPDYQQALAQEEAASAAVEISKAVFYPKLDLTGSLGRTGSRFFPDQANEWSVGLHLSVPLFTGGKNYYNARAAIETRSATESVRRNIARTVLNKLEQGYTTFSEAIEKLKVDEQFRVAAKERSAIGRAKYNNGLLTFEEWDIIENDLIAREKSYLQSERDRVIAEAAWEQAQGKGVLP